MVYLRPDMNINSECSISRNKTKIYNGIYFIRYAARCMFQVSLWSTRGGNAQEKVNGNLIGVCAYETARWSVVTQRVILTPVS